MITCAEKYLLVELCDDEKRELTTETGIILTRPKEDREDLVVSKATVINAGSTLFKKDDIVYFNYFSGNRLLIKGKDPQGKDDIEYLFVHEDDVLGKGEL